MKSLVTKIVVAILVTVPLGACGSVSLMMSKKSATPSPQESARSGYLQDERSEYPQGRYEQSTSPGARLSPPVGLSHRAPVDD